MSQATCCGLTGTAECRCQTHADELSAAVHSFISGRVRDRTDVDDIAQEALLRLYRNVHTLRDAGALEGWAFQIARNAIADHYRAPQRRATPVAPADVADLVPPSDVQEPDDSGKGLAECVAGLLQRVPEGYRHALELTDLRGMTQNRAAAELGLSTSGMKSRVQRGRRILRDEVATCCRIALDTRGGLADLTPRASDDATC